MQILTDFSGVLAGGLAGFSKKVSEKLGIPTGLFEGYLEMNEPWFWQLYRGRVTEDEFWDAVAEGFTQAMGRNGGSLAGEELKNIFHINMQKPVPGTLDVYRRIMYYPVSIGGGGRVDKGIPKIGVVSDNIAEMVPLFHKWYPGVFNMVEKEFWSCSQDCIKADPCFFKLLLKSLGGKPSDYLLIDGEKRNVELAMVHGIPAIHFKNAEQLEAEMVELGFVFYPKASLSA